MTGTNRSIRALPAGHQDDWSLLAEIEDVLADRADDWDDGAYGVVLTDDLGDHRGDDLDEVRSSFEEDGHGAVRRVVLTATSSNDLPRCEVALGATEESRVVVEHPGETAAEDLAGLVERLVVRRASEKQESEERTGDTGADETRPAPGAPDGADADGADADRPDADGPDTDADADGADAGADGANADTDADAHREDRAVTRGARGAGARAASMDTSGFDRSTDPSVVGDDTQRPVGASGVPLPRAVLVALAAVAGVVLLAWWVSGAEIGALLRNPWVVTVGGGLVATLLIWIVRGVLRRGGD